MPGALHSTEDKKVLKKHKYGAGQRDMGSTKWVSNSQSWKSLSHKTNTTIVDCNWKYKIDVYEFTLIQIIKAKKERKREEGRKGRCYVLPQGHGCEASHQGHRSRAQNRGHLRGWPSPVVTAAKSPWWSPAGFLTPNKAKTPTLIVTIPITYATLPAGLFFVLRLQKLAINPWKLSTPPGLPGLLHS